MSNYRPRHQEKAGLTCNVQVYKSYFTLPCEKLGYDLVYINNMRALTDLGLLFSAISVLFLQEGTEAIKAGKNTEEDNLCGTIPQGRDEYRRKGNEKETEGHRT